MLATATDDTTGTNAPPALPNWRVRQPVILQVLPALEGGGVERGTVEIAEAIIKAGGKAIVTSRGGGMVKQLEAIGAKHITLPVHTKNPFKMWLNINRLVRLIRDEGVDLVHARSRAPAWSAYAACKKAGVPYVTTFHHTYSFASRPKHFYNSVMGKGDHVIAISKFVARYMRKYYAIEEDRMTLIPRAADVETFNPEAVTDERVAKLHNAWGVSPDLPIIMMPGRVSRIKGHDILVDALAILKKDCLFQCLFVGSDQGRSDLTEELQQQIEHHGLEGNIRMVGHCDDMPAAFKLADVVTVPSKKPEGFGRVAVEAAAMGKPVVVPDHGAGPETVIDGKTGYVVKPLDAAALAEGLKKALQLDEDAREKMAQAARTFVSENYTTAHLTGRTLAIYDRLISKKDTP